MMNLGRLETLAGRPAQAREWYQKALKMRPDNVNALLLLAEISEEEKRGELIRKAYEVAPFSEDAMLAMAGRHVEQGDHEKAQPIVERLLQRAPWEPVVLNLAIRTYLQAGVAQRAVEVAERYVEKFPQRGNALMLKAMSYLAKGDASIARDALQRVLELEPENAGAWLLLARLEFDSGNVGQAARHAQQIEDLGYDGADALRLEADIAWRKGDRAQALALYEKAWQEAPTTEHALSLARATWSSGERDEARAFLRAQIETAPSPGALREALGDMLYMEERYDRAAEVYRQVVAEAPANGLVMDKLAEVYSLLGDDRALDTAQAAHDALSDHAETQSTLGWLLVEAGQVQRGLNLLQQAEAQLDMITTPSGRATIRYQLADAYRQSGNDAAAREILEGLLASDVGFPERESAERLLRRVR